MFYRKLFLHLTNDQTTGFKLKIFVTSLKINGDQNEATELTELRWISIRYNRLQS